MKVYLEVKWPILIDVKTQTNRSAIIALAGAGILWGLNVPLTKLALGWLGPGWLTVVRFAVAAPVLALVGRRGLRDALTPRILAWGAIGFGAVIVLQNAGIERTSVSHAAVVVGAVPVLVALIAAGLGQTATRALTWAGYAVALIGIAFVAGAQGGGALQDIQLAAPVDQARGSDWPLIVERVHRTAVYGFSGRPVRESEAEAIPTRAGAARPA